MEILYFDVVASTQEYLISALKNGTLKAPIAIIAHNQTDGRGSRGNEWIAYDGNLFLSFAIPIQELPQDLEIRSASIYFAMILKNALLSFGSDIHIKWPNDFFIDDKKVGGIITSKSGNNIICGIGLNTKKSDVNFAILDVDIKNDILVKCFFDLLAQKISWKNCFESFKCEFEYSKKLSVHINDKKVLLKDAILLDDGSLQIDDKIIYSLR